MTMFSKWTPGRIRAPHIGRRNRAVEGRCTEYGPDNTLMAVLTHCDCRPSPVAPSGTRCRTRTDTSCGMTIHLCGASLSSTSTSVSARIKAAHKPGSPEGRGQRLEAGPVHALKRSHGALPEEGVQSAPGRARRTDRDVSTGAACCEGRWTRGATWRRGGCFSVWTGTSSWYPTTDGQACTRQESRHL